MQPPTGVKRGKNRNGCQGRENVQPALPSAGKLIQRFQSSAKVAISYCSGSGKKNKKHPQLCAIG